MRGIKKRTKSIITIPNKIKIRIDSETKELSDYWILKNETNDKDVEYVQKDVLLDWAKERYEYFSQNPGKSGERDVCLQLIDRINAL